MKKFIKSLMLTAALIAPAMASADFLDNICPYGGLEGKWQNIPGRSDWSRVLQKSHFGGSLFVGARFCEFLGLEVGYTDLWERNRTHTFAAGENFFGNGDTGGAQTRITTRFSSGYIDLNGYYPCFFDCFDFIGSIGISAMKPRINVRVPDLGPDETGFIATDASRLEEIRGYPKAVFRLGAGAQYMICECIGVRGMVRYENTSALRVRVPDQSEFTAPFNVDGLRRPFRDSVSVALGVFAAY